MEENHRTWRKKSKGLKKKYKRVGRRYLLEILKEDQTIVDYRRVEGAIPSIQGMHVLRDASQREYVRNKETMKHR